MNAGHTDPELKHHWKKIDAYEAREEWVNRYLPVLGKPFARFFARRKEAHKRAYEAVAIEY